MTVHVRLNQDLEDGELSHEEGEIENTSSFFVSGSEEGVYLKRRSIAVLSR